MVCVSLCRITVANLILEYILANAAAIRGFAPYFAMLVNKPSDFFITPYTAPYGMTYQLDWCAGVLEVLHVFMEGLEGLKRSPMSALL